MAKTTTLHAQILNKLGAKNSIVESWDQLQRLGWAHSGLFYSWKYLNLQNIPLCSSGEKDNSEKALEYANLNIDEIV